ncbi:sugar phosphate isomerase/epimerase [Albibacterium sp.]|uniref:sugar phosphate isomerase/epimerase family protein n=1 Tax=Albibacterium sp. TaxID=2952885 RepID=UPI002BA16D19|nr:sugar phosphate isomerase/epimerase [Albibacterium sp.]HUH18874.1 sugar phosphate isomerase/epimerase [Albibacterium sp.]
MKSRKDFLRQSAMLAAGAIILPSCMSGGDNTSKTQDANNEASGTASDLNIGLQLYTLREIIGQDVTGVIGKVAAIGYKDVESYGFSSTGGYWGLSPLEFKALLDQNNLVSTSGHYGIEEFIRTDSKDELQAIIEAAKVIGNEYVTVPYLSEDLRSLDSYKMIADKLNIAAEMCKEAGLKLGYHNHDFEFADLGDGETALKIFMKNTDPALVQFELDLYWAVRSGNDPLALFKEFPGRFAMWHIKDMDKTTPGLNTEIGSGSIDYKAIFTGAKESGMKHIFVEQENFSIDPFESITQSFNYVNTELI